jgi:hypothetical protein
MDFRKTTDELFDSLTAPELAKEIGCSVSAVNQARSKERALGYRSPPDGWEAAALRLARKQIAHFTRLAEKLAAKR